MKRENMKVERRNRMSITHWLEELELTQPSTGWWRGGAIVVRGVWSRYNKDMCFEAGAVLRTLVVPDHVPVDVGAWRLCSVSDARNMPN
jgi:hypothetical protein